MLGPRQFSLRWMFLEAMWIALAIGLIRGVGGPNPVLGLLALHATTASMGAAIGGFYGDRADGASWALLGAVVVSRALPAL